MKVLFTFPYLNRQDLWPKEVKYIPQEGIAGNDETEIGTQAFWLHHPETATPYHSVSLQECFIPALFDSSPPWLLILE